jgi:hypothetical protein
MAPAVRSSFLRRIFSFPVMVSSLLMVLAVLTVRGRFNDPDMWWHMRTGQVIWTTHTIPRVDLFSWTAHHHAWVPHEWLSQTIIYGAYRFGGYSGLMFFLCGFTAALLIAGYLLCSIYAGNAKVALLGALTIWFFSTSGTAIRPQLIGYLLLIVELLLFHLGSTRSPRWFFCLPPLFAVWVNCHGSFFLGLAVGCLLYASSFVAFHAPGFVAFPWPRKARWSCGAALVLSLVALFLNPVGLHQVLYPLETMLGSNLDLIQEFQPLVLTSARGVGLLLVLACIAFLMISRYATLYWHELALLGAGTWLALSHQRMVFVFGILAAPIVCRLLSSYWDRYEPERDLPIANGVLILAAVLIAVAAFPSRASLREQVRRNNPAGAVDYIRAQHLDGHMLNDWTYGGYLTWAMPEHPDFIDGRGDVFDLVGVVKDFGAWATLQTDPRLLLSKYQIDFCLLPPSAPMSHVLPLLPGWKVAYSDDTAVVFVRDRAH